jgi:hypothetical protein
VLLVVAVLVAVVGYAVFSSVRKAGPPRASAPEGCTARVGGNVVFLTTAQARNAATIAAVATRRALPARAASIALTAAYQESDLLNLRYGDSDSLGLFQQRPSQGWGTPRQVMNPSYAANAFYDELMKVPGYQAMAITSAAQEVQRSAYPSAYAAHERDGRDLASALTGNSPAALSCLVHEQHLAHQHMQRNGLTRRANAVRMAIRSAYGDLPLGGFAAGGVNTGHMAGSLHYQGRAIDVFFRPADAGNRVRGWALAQFLVANASRLHIEHVIYDERIWSAGSKSQDGWRVYTPPELTGSESAATLAVLEHRDHVHVDVW